MADQSTATMPAVQGTVIPSHHQVLSDQLGDSRVPAQHLDQILVPIGDFQAQVPVQHLDRITDQLVVFGGVP